MLIKLYDLPVSEAMSGTSGVVVRKPLAPEHGLVADWVATQFSNGWASEARVALSNRPVSLFVAAQDVELVGFCCYDAIALGFVGPVGVAPAVRRARVGAALLRACLDDMRSVGYAYAVAGAVGAPEFFQRVAGAAAIEGSAPGIYRGLLRN